MMRRCSLFLKGILTLITLIADVAAVGALICSVCCDLLPLTTLQIGAIFVALLLLLAYLLAKTLSYFSQLNLLYQLSARGHLHSMRMVLLVDKERENEAQHLKAEQADFNFEITPCKAERSSVIYDHNFKVRKKYPGAVNVPTWIFGDMDIKPEEAQYTIRGSTWKDSEPQSEDIKYNEVQEHNGIYKFEWKFDSETPKSKIDADLRYVRKNAFPWNRNHILIIYPDSFFKDIKEMAFSVKVDAGDISRVQYVSVIEINGTRAPRDAITLDKSNLEGGGYIFKTGEYIKVHKGSIYIITVHVKH